MSSDPERTIRGPANLSHGTSPAPPLAIRPAPWATCLALLIWIAAIGCRPANSVTPATDPPGENASSPNAPSPSPPSDTAAGYFRLVPPECGIDLVYRNGEEADEYSILESIGGGVGLLDYDQDGWLDVFLTGGGYFDDKQCRGYPNRLYRNEGNWKFRDVTRDVQLDGSPMYGNGCAVADYDRDGWPDLLLTGYGRLVLYRNERGEKFTDVTAQVGLHADKPDVHWSTSAAWGDLNQDGYVDLFVAHYVDWSFANHPKCRGYGPDQPVDVCAPNEFNPLGPQLFLSHGDGTFREVSRSAGLHPGKALGVLLFDADEDGRLDIYVANDTLPNHLYLNQGEGRFQEVGRMRGVAAGELGSPDGSMGVALADLDGSGRMSLLVTNFQRQMHAVYLNGGGGLFDHRSSLTGIASLGTNHVGWGAAFLDFDRDGDEDLAIANGHVIRYPTPPQSLAQDARLLENVPRGGSSGRLARFRDVTAQGGPYFARRHRGRGLAVGDLDNDGRPDLVICQVDEPAAVLENQVRNEHHWLGIELRPEARSEPVGARLALDAGAVTQYREVAGGGSVFSSSDRRVLFGLGSTPAIQRLTVRWPSGREQAWDGESLGVDRYVRLIEGQPDAEPLDAASVPDRRATRAGMDDQE